MTETSLQIPRKAKPLSIPLYNSYILFFLFLKGDLDNFLVDWLFRLHYEMNNILIFCRTRSTTLHHGGKDFALDSSPLLDLGFAILHVLLNKILSVPS